MSIFPKLFGHDKKLERFFRAVDFLEWGSMGRLAAAMGIPVRIYSEWAGVSGFTNPVCELAS